MKLLRAFASTYNVYDFQELISRRDEILVAHFCGEWKSFPETYRKCCHENASDGFESGRHGAGCDFVRLFHGKMSHNDESQSRRGQRIPAPAQFEFEAAAVFSE